MVVKYKLNTVLTKLIHIEDDVIMLMASVVWVYQSMIANKCLKLCWDQFWKLQIRRIGKSWINKICISEKKEMAPQKKKINTGK